MDESDFIGRCPTNVECLIPIVPIIIIIIVIYIIMINIIFIIINLFNADSNKIYS